MCKERQWWCLENEKKCVNNPGMSSESQESFGYRMWREFENLQLDKKLSSQLTEWRLVLKVALLNCEKAILMKIVVF